MLKKIKFLKRNLSYVAFFNRAVHLLKEKYSNRDEEKHDLETTVDLNEIIPAISQSFLGDVSFPLVEKDQEKNSYLLEMYLDHRFNLLGSGWVKYDYATLGLGLDGHQYDKRIQIESFDQAGEWLKEIVLSSHLNYAKSVWRHVSEGYEPIDWQKDAKTGFRWSSKTWFKKQFALNIGTTGVDIKNPWELSRFQHLTQMTLLAHQFPEKQAAIVQEFKDQVLDFIATNPVAMGVNWYSTMDVGIRAAMWLMAYDLFKQVDRENVLDEPFEMNFTASIYSHGKHIAANLEYK